MYYILLSPLYLEPSFPFIETHFLQIYHQRLNYNDTSVLHPETKSDASLFRYHTKSSESMCHNCEQPYSYLFAIFYILVTNSKSNKVINLNKWLH